MVVHMVRLSFFSDSFERCKACTRDFSGRRSAPLTTQNILSAHCSTLAEDVAASGMADRRCAVDKTLRRRAATAGAVTLYTNTERSGLLFMPFYLCGRIHLGPRGPEDGKQQRALSLPARL